MSIKRVLIILGIVLGVCVLGILGYFAYRAPQAKVELQSKVNEALAKSTQGQVLTSVEIYYNNKKTVPLKMSDLQSYLPQYNSGLNLVEYHYIDSKNADVCLAFNPKVGQKCQRFTGK